MTTPLSMHRNVCTSFLLNTAFHRSNDQILLIVTFFPIPRNKIPLEMKKKKRRVQNVEKIQQNAAMQLFSTSEDNWKDSSSSGYSAGLSVLLRKGTVSKAVKLQIGNACIFKKSSQILFDHTSYFCSCYRYLSSKRFSSRLVILHAFIWRNPEFQVVASFTTCRIVSG